MVNLILSCQRKIESLLNFNSHIQQNNVSEQTVIYRDVFGSLFSMSEIWYSSLFHDRGLVGLQPIKNPSTMDKKSLLYLVTIDKHKRIA